MMTTRRLALAGLVGPPLFAAIVVLLTAVKWDFLHELGWSGGPFDSSDTPWPSSLALGDYGFLQVLNFLLLGFSALALAVALLRLLRQRLGPSLLVLLGVGFLASAVRTDYKSGRGGGPDTWNGAVHAAGFTVVVFVGFLSMFVLSMQFRQDDRWRTMSGPSFVAGIAALAGFAATVAGGGSLFFYLFLGALLAWISFVAAHALRLTRAPAS